MVVHITLEMRLKLRYCFFFCCSVICVNTWKHLRVHWPYLLIRQHEHLIFSPSCNGNLFIFWDKTDIFFFLKKCINNEMKLPKTKVNWALKQFFSVCFYSFVCVCSVHNGTISHFGTLIKLLFGQRHELPNIIIFFSRREKKKKLSLVTDACFTFQNALQKPHNMAHSYGKLRSQFVASRCYRRSRCSNCT